MKIGSTFTLAMGAAAAASALPGRKIDSNPTQLQHNDPSMGSVRPSKRSDDSCRARIMETYNRSAVYTVHSEDPEFCIRWADRVLMKCPDVQELTLSENIVNAFKFHENVVASTNNLILRGWVSTVGPTNKTIENCTAEQFDQLVDKFKQGAKYKITVGSLIGVGALSVAGAVIGAGALVCSKIKKVRTPEPERATFSPNMNRRPIEDAVSEHELVVLEPAGLRD